MFSALILIPLVAIMGAYALGNLTPVSAQTNNGFLIPVNLSNDDYNASYPWIATSGSSVYVAWTEEAHGIYFRASPDNGSSWYPAIDTPGLRISTQGGTTSYPIVYALGSEVYVVWSQSVNNVLQIFFAGSTNNGTTFAAPIQLSSGDSTNGWITPVIAAAGSDVYVAYTGSGKNSFVIASDNYGATWNKAYHYGVTHEPQLAAIGSNGYAVSDGLQYAVTHNGGVSWTEVLNGTNEGDEPWIAASGSYVYLVSQTKTANSTIHFIVCSNYGMNCNPSLPGVDLADSVGLNDTWEPQMIAAGNYVYLTYHTLTYPIQNYYRYSANNGQTWSPLFNLTEESHLVGWAPQLATTGCGGGYSCTTQSPYVYTAWPVRNSLTSNTWSMFAAISSDYGATWTPAPGINVSGSGYPSSGPNDIATDSLAAYGNHAYLVWQNNITANSNSQVIFTESNPNFTSVSSSSSVSTVYSTVPSTSGSGPSPVSTTTTHSTSSSTLSFPFPSPTVSTVGPPSSSVSLVGTAIIAASVVAVAVAASAVFISRRKKT